MPRSRRLRMVRARAIILKLVLQNAHGIRSPKTDKTLDPQRKTEINRLSELLHISHSFALTLLLKSPSTHGHPPVDVAIKTFHDLITTRLEAIKLLLGLKTSFILEEDGSNQHTWGVICNAFDVIYTDATPFKPLVNPTQSVGGLFPSISSQIDLTNTYMAETLPTNKRLAVATTLSEDIVALRVQALRAHQRALVKLGYIVAASGETKAADMKWIVEWLQKREDCDSVTVLMIA